MFRLVSLCGRPPVTAASRCTLARGQYRSHSAERHVVDAQTATRVLEEAKPEDVTKRVVSVVKAFDKVDPAKVTPVAHFQKDLGIDSLDTVELLLDLEDEFVVEIPDIEAEKIRSCADAIQYISDHPYAK